MFLYCKKRTLFIPNGVQFTSHSGMEFLDFTVHLNLNFHLVITYKDLLKDEDYIVAYDKFISICSLFSRTSYLVGFWMFNPV